MKKNDIKRHLKDYSIYSNRSSTINHAFASALSIADEYDINKINLAIELLGQDPENDLNCAYCDKLAETWDHIKAIVSKQEFSGHGHQINNLIPCCKNCNSAKGNKDWLTFLKFKKFDTTERIIRIENYINNNYLDAKNLLKTDEFNEDLRKFNDLKKDVLTLLQRGDEQAAIIRTKLRQANKTE